MPLCLGLVWYIVSSCFIESLHSWRCARYMNTGAVSSDIGSYWLRVFERVHGLGVECFYVRYKCGAVTYGHS